MKRIISVILLILFLLAIILVSDEYRTEDNVFKIGVATGLTGYAKNWGEGEIKAYQLAYDEVKDTLGIPIKFIVEDTKSDGLGTVNAISKLIQVDKVSVILGPTWGDSFQGGFSIAEKAKVTIVTPSSALETIENKNDFSYLFSTWWPQVPEASALGWHMQWVDGVNRVIVLHDLDAFNTKFAELFKRVADGGPKYLSTIDVSVPIGTSDFRTTIAKIKSEKPDAVLILMQDTSMVGPFMKQLKEQDVKVKVYSTTSAQNEENVKKFPGQFEGLTYSFPSYNTDENYQKLQERLRNKYGEGTDEGPAFVNAYNAAKAVFETIKNGARTGTEIRDSLRKIKVQGIGVKLISFDSNNGQIPARGENMKFVIKKIENNNFVEIE